MLFHISVCSNYDSIVSHLPQQLESLLLLCQTGLRLHTCTILLAGSQGWKSPAGCQKFCTAVYCPFQVVHFHSTMLCSSFVHCKWDSKPSQLHGIRWSLVARWWLAGLQMQVYGIKQIIVLYWSCRICPGSLILRLFLLCSMLKRGKACTFLKWPMPFLNLCISHATVTLSIPVRASTVVNSTQDHPRIFSQLLKRLPFGFACIARIIG